jgi:N-acetylglucosaminyldiphosphoundecaprenol N-acetyl-beta-D-mannosaminyltransferase
MIKRMNILGVQVNPVTYKEAVAKIADYLSKSGQFFVTTPNPEIILYAHKHPEYREILNKSDLALPDGAGLLLVAKLLGQTLPERVSGSDIVPEILRLARENGQSVALLGGLDQATVELAATKLREQGTKVVYANYGVGKEDWNNSAEHEKIINGLQAVGPELVLVGFGHPKQEEWIDRYRSRLSTVRLFIGCGGTLDFLAGKIRRAPVWMRPWFEWLWRLAQEPKRIHRIFNAVIIFPLTVTYDSFRKKN